MALGNPPGGVSLILVCKDGCVLDGTPDLTHSSCAGQKDTGFVWFSAWNAWPRGTRKHGNVSLLLLIYLLVTTT